LGLRRNGLSHIADDGLPTIIYMDVLDADKLLPAVTQASKNLNLGCISPHQPGRSRFERPIRRSVPNPLSSLARTAIAAVCVQAIWRASAPSISSFGAATSIIARAALIWVSETVPYGERAAACSCNKEALTKSLDVVPRALFSRCHQSLLSPSGGWVCAT
jgi:hypothetical protein